MVNQFAEVGEFIDYFVSGEGSSSSSTKDRPIDLSDVSRLVADIMRLGHEPERMKTELERVLGGLINRILTLEKPLDPCTKNPNEPVHPTWRLRLQFKDKLPSLVSTGKDIEGEGGNPIRVELVDSQTGQVIDYDPVAWGEVQIVLLEKNYNDGTTNGTTEKHNGAVLCGQVHYTLESGVGHIKQIKFKHASKWTRKQEYRLGARMPGHFPGIHVEEAVTEPFTVEDKRANPYPKSLIPSLSDEVWRLTGISKEGTLRKRLHSKNIDTVKDLLTLLNTNPQRLAKILNMSTTSQKWEAIVGHARKCPPIPQQKTVPSRQLSTSEKADAQKLVVPVDDMSSLDFSLCIVTAIGLNESTGQETPSADAISHVEFDSPNTANLDCIVMLDTNNEQEIGHENLINKHSSFPDHDRAWGYGCSRETETGQETPSAGAISHVDFDSHGTANLDFIVTPDTNNEEEIDHENLHGKHSPVPWACSSFGASSNDILRSPIPFSSCPIPQGRRTSMVFTGLTRKTEIGSPYITDISLGDCGYKSLVRYACERPSMNKDPTAHSQDNLFDDDVIRELSSETCDHQAMESTDWTCETERRCGGITRVILRRRRVSGRTTMNKDPTAHSQDNFFDDDHNYDNTTPGSQAGLCSTLFSMMRWLSVKLKVEKCLNI